MCRLTSLSGNSIRTGLTDKIADAPPLIWLFNIKRGEGVDDTTFSLT